VRDLNPGPAGERTVSCVFLCGHQSPYGIAHAAAIARCFQLKAVIIADDQRWRLFRKKLSGSEETGEAESGKVRRLVRKVRLRWRDHQTLRSFKSYGAPVIQVHNANTPDVIGRVKEMGPDVLICAAYPQILGPGILKSAPRGAINFHPSLLPRCRGAHPHYWCLASGEEKGGVSAHFMTERIDDGDLIAQRPIDLAGLYYDDLYRQIIRQTPTLVQDVAHFLSDPSAAPTPQDAGLVTRFRNDREEDRRLDFLNIDAVDLMNRIRAGRAFACHRGIRVHIDRADIISPADIVSGTPGAVVAIDRSGVLVAARDGCCILITSVVSGRRKPSAYDWASSSGLAIGDQLQ